MSSITLSPVSSTLPSEADRKLTEATSSEKSETAGMVPDAATKNLKSVLITGLKVLRVFLSIDKCPNNSNVIDFVTKTHEEIDKQYRALSEEELQTLLGKSCEEFMGSKSSLKETQSAEILEQYERMLDFTSPFQMTDSGLLPPAKLKCQSVFDANACIQGIRDVAKRHLLNKEDDILFTEGIVSGIDSIKPEEAFLAKIEKSKTHPHGKAFIFICPMRQLVLSSEGNIYKAWNLADRDIVCIKRPFGYSSGSRFVSALLNQQYVLELLYQRAAEQKMLVNGALPHIQPPFMTVFKSNSFYGGVGKFYEGNTLFDFVKDNNPLTTKKCTDLGLQMAEILHTLVKLKISHCDLKLENLVFDENNRLVLIDWSAAYFLGEKLPENFDKLYRPLGVTNPYTSHKAVKDWYEPSVNGIEREFGINTFAIGLINFCIFTGRYPYGEVPLRDRKLSILSAKLSILSAMYDVEDKYYFDDTSGKHPKELLALIKQMCTYQRTSPQRVEELLSEWQKAAALQSKS